VGHETDFTVADLVADLRAPTPSAAAELAVQDKAAVAEEVAALVEGMDAYLRGMLSGLQRRLAYASAHPLLSDPRRLWERDVQRVDELSARLPQALRRVVERAGLRLFGAAGRLDAVSPLKVLARGYAIAESGGKVLTAASQAKTGDVLRVRLARGELQARVTEVKT
jgi:exodeoxyribonuclease VII large subunit